VYQYTAPAPAKPTLYNSNIAPNSLLNGAGVSSLNSYRIHEIFAEVSGLSTALSALLQNYIKY
jgi:hypothetical protein